MPGRTESRRGFTLIETLVALLILSLSLGAIFNIFSGSLQAVRTGAERAHALAVAQSRLAMIEAGDVTGVGVTTGEDQSGYRWQTDIHEMPNPPVDSVASGTIPFEIVVTVSWGVANARSVELATVRVMPR